MPTPLSPRPSVGPPLAITPASPRPTAPIEITLENAKFTPVLPTAESKAFLQTRLDWVKEEERRETIGGAAWRKVPREERRPFLDGQINMDDKSGLKLLKYDSPQDGYTYGLEVQDGTTVQQWYLTEFFHRYKNEAPVIFINRADPLMQMSMEWDEFCTKLQEEPAAIVKVLQIGVTRRASEQADAAKMHDFDLPKNQKILYTGVYSPTETESREHTSYFGPMLSDLGYSIVGNGRDVIPATSDLLAVLEARFDAALAEGVRNHVLHLSAHGNQQEIVLTTKDNQRLRITPVQLLELLKKPKFQECSFLVNLEGCKSSGFQSGAMADLLRVSSPAGRIRIITQSKQEIVNVPFYNFCLIHFLKSGLPFGQAHLAADKLVKTHYPGLDAGVFSSGQAGGLETARHDENGGMDTGRSVV